jgi:hypothetical protein
MPEQSAKAMSDPMAKWTPVPDCSVAAIVRRGWSAKPVVGLSIALVTGNIAAARSLLAPGMSEVGLWQIASALDHVIRIAHDKALFVATTQILFETGWNPAGFSVTDASGAYGVIEIVGTELRDIVAEASAADIDAGSRSAAVLFAGIPGLVVRTAPEVGRVFLEAGFMTYLWRWLETRT